MTKWLFYIFTFFFIAAGLTNGAVAADIACVKENGSSGCGHVWISGEIVAGDAEKFDKALRQNDVSLKGVLLSSPGGSPHEAMKIGRRIRERNLSAQAPVSTGKEAILSFGKETLCRGPDCFCASACFLIWTGGKEKAGDRLGLHRPAPVLEEDGSAADIYRKKSSMPSLLALLEDTRNYLKEMNMPQRDIDRMTRVRATDVYWLSAGEALAIAPRS